MKKSFNNLEPYQPEDTEAWLAAVLIRLVLQAYERGQITKLTRDNFVCTDPKGLDQLAVCFTELGVALENYIRYIQLCSRIKTAETVIEQEPDMSKRRLYVTKMRELIRQLEGLKPARELLPMAGSEGKSL